MNSLPFLTHLSSMIGKDADKHARGVLPEPTAASGPTTATTAVVGGLNRDATAARSAVVGPGSTSTAAPGLAPPRIAAPRPGPPPPLASQTVKQIPSSQQQPPRAKAPWDQSLNLDESRNVHLLQMLQPTLTAEPQQQPVQRQQQQALDFGLQMDMQRQQNLQHLYGSFASQMPAGLSSFPSGSFPFGALDASRFVGSSVDSYTMQLPSGLLPSKVSQEPVQTKPPRSKGGVKIKELTPKTPRALKVPKAPKEPKPKKEPKPRAGRPRKAAPP